MATLYIGTKNASSWALRAWLALKLAEFEFTEQLVDIRRPQRFHNLNEIASLSPSASVPLLVMGDRVIFDSLAIMEFANDHAGGALLPRDLTLRGVARSLCAWHHAGLSDICARISFESAFYPFKRPLVAKEQQEAHRLLRCFEENLSLSGGPYLFGSMSLADIMNVPSVIRLARHSVDTKSFPRTAAWFDTILRQERVAEWLSEADALPHIWYDSYLVDGDASPLRAC